MALPASALVLIYGMLWNTGFFMSRKLSSDIIVFTCTIEVFIVNLLPWFRSSEPGLTKLCLLVISILGYGIMMQ